MEGVERTRAGDEGPQKKGRINEWIRITGGDVRASSSVSSLRSGGGGGGGGGGDDLANKPRYTRRTEWQSAAGTMSRLALTIVQMRRQRRMKCPYTWTTTRQRRTTQR